MVEIVIAKLELISDIDMCQWAMRWEISYTCQRSFDASEPSKHIIYENVNNFYG